MAVYATRPGTIGHSVLEAARRWPGRTSFIFGRRQSDFANYAEEVLAAARCLVGIGVAAGDHVGILMPNCWEYAILSDAATMIGAAAVVLNSRYRGEDLRYVIDHARIKVLFTSGVARPHLDLRGLLVGAFPELAQWTNRSSLQVAACPHLARVFHFGAPEETRWPVETDFAASGQQIDDEVLARRVAAVDPDDTALVIFSSGTTTKPKACLLSHRSVTAVAGGMAERLELGEQDVFWDPLPLYHLSSHLPLNACRQTGAAFVSQAHFDARGALAELERVGASVCYTAFPALTAALIDHPDFKTRDLSKVRAQINIGAPDQLAKFAAAMPNALQIACYGLTECGGIATMSSPHDESEQRIRRVGRPLSGQLIRIIDPATLADLPQGETGEIVISGAIFSGYYGDPAQTEKVMLPDGWLRSGDLGWIDGDGQLAYAGRIKDMLKIGGENVAAIEVESFLSAHPKIRMVQVIGAPDDRLVEVVAAYIELNDGETMTEDEVLCYCAGEIASFKLPRFVRFVSEWPMSATKVQKFKLVESFVPDGRIDVNRYINKPSRSVS